MVKKIIACADIHFRNLEGLEDLQTTLQIFIEKCKEIIAEEDSPENVRIVVGGDVFESKINISNESNLAVGWFFRELNNLGCKTIVFAGNHDLILYNLQRVDSLTPIFELGNLENVVYLDSALEYRSGCYVDDNIVWCLYSIFDDYNRPEIDEMKIRHPDKKLVGLVHGDVNGAVNFAGRMSEHGLDAGVFEGLDFVIAGHIHKRQEIKKNGVRVVYCSSMKQKDFGETVNQHGFVLWKIYDKKAPTYEFIDVVNPECGFYKFKVEDIKDIEENKEELLNY